MYDIVFCVGTSIVMVLHVQFTDASLLHIFNIFFQNVSNLCKRYIYRDLLKFLTVRKKFTPIITFREQRVVSVNSN